MVELKNRKHVCASHHRTANQFISKVLFQLLPPNGKAFSRFCTNVYFFKRAKQGHSLNYAQDRSLFQYVIPQTKSSTSNLATV